MQVVENHPEGVSVFSLAAGIMLIVIYHASFFMLRFGENADDELG